MKHSAVLFGCAVGLAHPALAQDTTAAAERSAVHEDSGAEIIVTAPYVRELDILSGKSVVTGDDLVRDIRAQIGETLVRQPGVSATSFGPGASRPVLRGFQGERVRVLTDGLGSLDISNTSADHAVTIDPLTAERIEVLRGPAVLLFGSQAIGGAVNVIDRRIPRGVPLSGFHVDAIGTLASAADERSAGAALDVAVSPSVVAHIDGTYRKTGDLHVGGHVLTPDLRAEQLGIARDEAAEGHREAAQEAMQRADLRGRLPNSATETYTLGGGVALIDEGGNLGFSAAYYDSTYGVPARPGGGHREEEAEAGGGADDQHGAEHDEVSIAMKQFRADLRGEVVVGGSLLDRVRLRGGFADYEHTEFEGDEVGTVFNAEAFEGRLELVQADRDGWRGVVGFQGFTRNFDAVGEEAFVPPNTTDQYGVFALQELALGQVGLEVAGRFEHTSVRSSRVRLGLGEDAPVVGAGRAFEAVSGALGLSYAVVPRIKIGINGSRAVRAPAAEELFSNGPHIATQAYEIGNPSFSTEKSWGLELYARGEAGPLRFQLSGHASWFDDYIYETDTGVEQGELPVFEYRQGDARYYGVEGEITATLVRREGLELEANLVADYVDARLTGDGSGAIPRIPPFRVLGGLSALLGRFGGRVEVEQVARQSRVAAFETPTEAFTLANASLSWHPFGRAHETTIILSANNLFDVDARRHASFTKTFVPLPGRDVRLAARLSF